jgi:hypothetical protein
VTASTAQRRGCPTSLGNVGVVASVVGWAGVVIGSS